MVSDRSLFRSSNSSLLSPRVPPRRSGEWNRPCVRSQGAVRRRLPRVKAEASLCGRNNPPRTCTIDTPTITYPITRCTSPPARPEEKNASNAPVIVINTAVVLVIRCTLNAIGFHLLQNRIVKTAIGTSIAQEIDMSSPCARKRGILTVRDEDVFTDERLISAIPRAVFACCARATDEAAPRAPVAQMNDVSASTSMGGVSPDWFRCSMGE